MNKLIRNRLERSIEDATDTNRAFLKQEFKDILESNKSYMVKTDHICHSINSIDDKIKLLDDEVKQIQAYKKKLKVAKDLAQEVGSEVFQEFGISKIEGGVFSSITTTTATIATKLDFEVTDEDLLIQQGFYTKVIDMAKIKEYYARGDYRDLILSAVEITKTKVTRMSKLRINKRKAINNDQFDPIRTINPSDIDMTGIDFNLDEDAS